MTARTTATEIARLIVVDETYPELRALLARTASPKLMVSVYLRRNFPALDARKAAGEFTSADLLDALDEA